MDVLKYINNLSNADKARLIHGKGAWHTQEADGVPSIMMTDGPHGLRRQCDGNRGINDSSKATCFPAASAVASSWNRRSAVLVGKSIGCEALAQGVSVVLGPGVNIKRSPLCVISSTTPKTRISRESLQAATFRLCKATGSAVR